MLGLLDSYNEACRTSNIEPNECFVNQLKECETMSRATLDFVIDGGVTYHKLEDADFSVILDTLKKGGCIHSIKVPRNNLTDLVVPSISELILQSDSITELDLSANQITADGIKSIENAIIKSQSLTTISFAQNELNDEGVAMLVNAIKVNRTITHVNISDTGMANDAMNKLGAIIANSKKLQCVYLDNPHPTISPDDAAQRLFISMKVNTTITELSIARARLTDESAILIADFIKSNKTLKHLRLKSNGISSIGAEYIAEALKSNTTIQVLDLSYNRIGDKGGEAFGSMLEVNQVINRLDLSSNGIQGVGLLAICKSLAVNKGLTDICLWGNRIVDHLVMEEFHKLRESKKSILIDFSVHYTDDIPYVARTDESESPVVW